MRFLNDFSVIYNGKAYDYYDQVDFYLIFMKMAVRFELTI